MCPVPVTLHLPPAQLAGEMMPFYARLTDGLRALGHLVTQILHDRATAAATVEAVAGIHILDHGRVAHPRARNAGVAYVYPFWHLDPLGIRAFSSIGGRSFDPAGIDPAEATAFADRLRARLVGKRTSRYEQPPEVATFPQGCIAIFLQSEEHPDVAETCHLTARQMIRAVLDRDDPAPVVIKPHPAGLSGETDRFLRRLARQDARVTVTGANIHDILSAARAVVTINSATGIEAMLHRRPVILCGKADFHHIATTVARPRDMAAALEGPDQRPFDAYLYWYFRKNCLDATSETLAAEVLARFGA